MQARMIHPAELVPEAMQALTALGKAVDRAVPSKKTLDLVFLRASQINGCEASIEQYWRDLKRSGETDERLDAVGDWREARVFSEPERIALALAEAGARINDRANPLPDELWAEATKHYDEAALAGLVMGIGLVNLWNRLGVMTRQSAAEPVA